MAKDEKTKKAKPKYNSIIFDSFEEIAFYQWCEEAYTAGLIYNFVYHPPSYTLSTKQTYSKQTQLKTKIRYDERELLKPHVYTADFMVFVDPKIKMELFKNYKLFSTDGEILIDVKGSGAKADAKTIFSLNQKWLYDKFDVYVNKIIPDELFLKTWVPELCRYTEVKKDVKKKFRNTPTIKEYLKDK